MMPDKIYFDGVDEMAEKAALQAYPVHEVDDPMGANYSPIDVNENERWAYEKGFKAGRASGLRDGQKYVLNNLDSYGLCKPAEWSEEDEKMLKEIISFFKDGSVKLQHDLDLYAGFLEKRLKSLRPVSKESLQPHWKPSEEQTICLMKVITWLTEIGNLVDSGILADLKKQLETGAENE